MPPGGLPGSDLAGGDPAAAYAEGAAAALAAAGTGDALTRLHVTPLGDMPGPVLAGFTTLDILVHGWDLAKATGQPAALEAALAGHVLAFAHQALTEETRAEALRTQARLAAQADAGRAAVRLAFPLVVCFLPAFVLLTVIPTMAGALHSLAP